MRPDELFAWCFGGFVGLTIGYVVILFLSLRVIRDKGIKLIVAGLLTGIAATGYSIVTRMGGEIHFNGASMPSTISLEAVSGGASAPAILSRLAVVLVLGGIARLVAESLRQPEAGSPSQEASHD